MSMQESGEYVCHAENEAGQTSAAAQIEVQSLPIITVTPRTGMIHVREGERVRLECHATGHPEPTVKWNKHRDQFPL